MAKDLIAVIRDSGAQAGDLVYVRSSTLISVEGSRPTTSPDLLHLKAEALASEEPIVAVGPGTDETYADVVIDANAAEPFIVKAKAEPQASK